VLRAQAFESLFTLVPILLVAVISIFLRARASRRQRKRAEAARAEETAETAPAAASGQTTRTSGGPGSVRDLTSSREKAYRKDTRSQGRTQEPVRKAQGRKAARGRKYPWQRESTAAYPEPSAPAAGTAPAFAPAPPSTAQPESRESYAYPPPLSLNEVKIPPAGEPVEKPVVMPRPIAVSRRREAGPQDLRARMRARMRSERSAGMAAETMPVKRPSVTNRLERLPPLKRAVIWAEILGPPGGRQHPDAHG
jgi:hypothetical protein